MEQQRPLLCINLSVRIVATLNPRHRSNHRVQILSTYSFSMTNDTCSKLEGFPTQKRRGGRGTTFVLALTAELIADLRSM